jgi:homospermidine synthase
MTKWPVHGRIDGPIVMIGFGSIGKGTLPLIERHFDYDRSRMIILDPSDADRALADKHGVEFRKVGLTRDNYREILTPLLTRGGGRGFCVNLSVDTGSLDIMKLCRELGALYIDTVNEPWLGFYFDHSKGPAERSNYALREMTRAEAKNSPGGPTAVSCCGANPGMVSWFVKQALVDLAKDIEGATVAPKSREEWAALAQRLNVQGRAHRRARHPAGEASQAAGRVRQHLVGRGLRVGRHAAGRTRLGHA